MAAVPIRIGIVGFGGMGREHARVIAQSTEMTVGLVVEPNQSNINFGRDLFSNSIVDFHTKLTDDVIDSDIDAWIVASSTSTHVDNALFLLRKGQKVLLEKPISEDVQSARKLEKYVDFDSANLMMGHIVLWSPEFKSLVERLQFHGPIQHIRTLRQRSSSHRVRYPDESIFSLLLVHDFYCIQVLMHGKEPVQISGSVGFHDLGGVHQGRARLEWIDSVFSSSEANYFLPDDPPGLVDDEILVLGEGWVESARFTNGFDDALRGELEHFAAVVRGESRVPLGARYQDALQIQRWVDFLNVLTQQGLGEDESVNR